MEISRHINGSRWMELLPPEVKKRPINQIFMPGTHNSGTSGIETGLLPIENTWLKFAELFSFIPPVKSIIADANGFQELKVDQQLKLGIRYFDIRYSWSEKQGALYASHQFAGEKIFDIFTNTFNFIKENTQEVAILRLTRDQYHNHNEHSQDEKIQQLAIDIFSDLLVKREATFNDITIAAMAKKNCRVIVIFDKFYKDLNESFWTSDSKHLPFEGYANSFNKIDSLKNDVQEIDPKDNRINGLQFILTPKGPDYLTSNHSSIKSYRSVMQSQLQSFLSSEKESMQKKQICVITTDFPGTEFVQSIVSLNFK